ncbi:uncharacterized protein Z520_10176 [Fonsecaea multimorphosa CBS 102226]|uniref:XRCC4 coiled-coil domain-containing protein n=1 Tax=Fonsecaea multimorphosa CBS 102226 TaxID=1442371 RepID=A0A0D2GX25_9EURO|nr:uncharacterized protein Z520_10176 [Fonsecaea multimorphosa CBS 102226]KIX94150.1 hypothetical protein Z520_10176 [Fonsecaea multimorphosa CBS 102226]OAL19503.1 hypothetical protein AYO22_09665 [Fonsecaea multimorphosa]
MASTWIIRLVQDKTNSPILIKVAHKEGGHDLDLDLLATDGEVAYTGKVRQRSLKKLRAKNYDGNDEDWTTIISSILGTKTDTSISIQRKDQLEVTCSVSGKDPKTILSIAINNRVEDITQRLGTIELPQTEDTDDVDLFGWASQAVEKRDELQEDATSLKEQIKTKDEVMASLQRQIDELVEAKAEHEKQMLSKFALLLNEKKLKIRNMQRILSTAKTDQKKLKELQAVIGNEAAGVPRRNKRPADDTAEDEDDESDSFETTAAAPIIDPEREPSSPPSGNSTPTPSERDEDTDEDNLDAPATYSNRPRTRAMDPEQGQGLNKTQDNENTTGEAQGTTTVEDDDNDETASEADEL